MRSVSIRGESIRLDQLLKWAALVQSGGEAKVLIQNSQVSVNGEVETRRGRQVHVGDTVTVDESVSLQVVADVD